MSLVSQQSMKAIYSLKDSAISASSYETGYNYAMRALDRAIGVLQQLDVITEDAQIKITKE